MGARLSQSAELTRFHTRSGAMGWTQPRRFRAPLGLTRPPFFFESNPFQSLTPSLLDVSNSARLRLIYLFREPGVRRTGLGC
jgi:hypothetical protein